MPKRGKKEGRRPHSRLQPGKPQASQQAGRPSWAQMHAAHSAHIRLIRAMFSALLAARQLLGVPSPGSGEVTAFQRQGQGRTGPCGASRIQGSAQLGELTSEVADAFWTKQSSCSPAGTHLLPWTTEPPAGGSSGLGNMVTSPHTASVMLSRHPWHP